MKKVKITKAATPKQDARSYHGNTPEIKINRTLKPTSKENATLEAELGETVVTNLQQDGIPEFYKIGGKPHSTGGTPLNLPSNSFIFSKDKKLAIRDSEMQEIFGKSKLKKGYTPADISKTYDINEYREILANPFSDPMQIKTAELMIKNYNLKLGALALVQESQKGFDKGIPGIAQPYMESIGLTPDDLFVQEPPANKIFPQFKGGGEHLPQFQGGGGQRGKRIRIKKMPNYKQVAKKPIKGEINSDFMMRVYGNPGFVRNNDIWDGQQWVSTNLNKNNDTIPVTTGKTTKKQNIPKGSVKRYPDAEGYDHNDVQVGDYIKNADGRWEKVIGRTVSKYEGKFNDPNLGDKYNNAYGLIEDKFANDNVRKGFIENYRRVMEAVEPGKNLTQADIDAALAMSPDEIITNFLNKTKQNLAINKKLGDLSEVDKKDLWDNDRKYAQNAASNLGYEPLNTAQVAAFQAGYIGMQNMMKDDQYKDDLKDFKMIQTGVSDESISGTEAGSISQVDGWDGNTTSAQVFFPRKSELQTEDVEEIEEDAPIVNDIETLQPQDAENPARFWTQDLVNIAGDVSERMQLKKHLPWQATPQHVQADPTFTDFRGTAARIGSMANIGAQQAATMMDPQSFAATFANIQKGAVDPILKAQEAENRTNIGIANQFAMANAQSQNIFNQQKAVRDTALFDKTTIANQQFDNAKAMLRHKLRQDFNTAWTNRGITQSMNEQRDDFVIDPTTGFTYKKDTSRELPEAQSQTSVSDAARRIMNENPGISFAEALKGAKADAGLPENEGLPAGVNPAAYNYPSRLSK